MLSANNITPGSLTQFSPTGTVLSGATGFTGSSINTPSNIAADANGNIWVSNLGLPEITLLASNGTVLSGMSGYGGNILVQPAGLAIDSTQNAWVSDASIGYLYQFDNQGVLQHLISCCNNPDSLAIDSAGVLWAGDNANSDLTAATPLGVILQSNLSGGGLNGPRSISVDGGDHLWITNNNGSTLTEFAGTNSPQVPGSALSPSTGFGADAQMQQPFGVGIDPSGNVWVSSFGDNRLINFVGLGTPVKTPRIGPPQQP
jgi:streptogramin lyase